MPTAKRKRPKARKAAPKKSVKRRRAKVGNPSGSLWESAKKKASVLRAGSVADLYNFMVKATYDVPSPYPLTASRLKPAFDSLKRAAANGELESGWKTGYADWFGEEAKDFYGVEVDKRRFSKSVYVAAGKKYVDKLVADGYVHPKIPNPSRRRKTAVRRRSR